MTAPCPSALQVLHPEPGRKLSSHDLPELSAPFSLPGAWMVPGCMDHDGSRLTSVTHAACSLQRTWGVLSCSLLGCGWLLDRQSFSEHWPPPSWPLWRRGQSRCRSAILLTVCKVVEPSPAREESQPKPVGGSAEHKEWVGSSPPLPAAPPGSQRFHLGWIE